MVALFCTLTKPPMLGGVIPNWLNGKVMEPTSSIFEPVSRAVIGIVTVFVTPCNVSAPVAETLMVWPLAAVAGNAIGVVSWKLAVG